MTIHTRVQWTLLTIGLGASFGVGLGLAGVGAYVGSAALSDYGHGVMVLSGGVLLAAALPVLGDWLERQPAYAVCVTCHTAVLEVDGAVGVDGRFRCHRCPLKAAA